MAPFEALYGRKCRTPVCWDEVGERRLVGPKLVQITLENVKVVRDNLKIARDRQKSYADNRRRDLQFEIGDQVFLKISPWKGVLRFWKRGKLSPRYIGPYEIMSKVGPVAYKLKLPPELSRIHDTFHVSMLRKYIPDPSHVLREQPVQLKENLTYEEIPVQIVDRKEQVLRSKMCDAPNPGCPLTTRQPRNTSGGRVTRRHFRKSGRVSFVRGALPKYKTCK